MEDAQETSSAIGSFSNLSSGYYPEGIIENIMYLCTDNVVCNVGFKGGTDDF